MKFNKLLATTAAAATALPLSALAHMGTDAGGHHHFLDSLGHAFAHPFTGADHLAAMLAVGAWSALTMPGLRTAWRAPAAFGPAGGGCRGRRLWVPGVEPMIAASVLVLGLLVLVQQKMPWPPPPPLAAVFAFFHGAHGLSWPATAAWLPSARWWALHWARPHCISPAWCSVMPSCSATNGLPGSAVQPPPRSRSC
jgi:urease accessory protein